MSNFLRYAVPCFKCEALCTKDDDIFVLGIEKPYFNLIFHKNCYEEIQPTIGEFIADNIDKYLKLYEYYVEKHIKNK